MATASEASIDFNNTEIAFKSVSTPNLLRAKLLFKTFGSQFLVSTGPKLVTWAMRARLPITPVVKMTIFNQFCGGVTIEDCGKRVDELGQFGIRSILDYSVEGLDNEEDFEDSYLEMLRVVKFAADNRHISFAVFKVTALGSTDLLEKMSAGKKLSADEARQKRELHRRVYEICAAAAKANVRVLIDAEDSWIQPAIDDLAYEMMDMFNGRDAVVYNTFQLYRKDRLQYLKDTHTKLKANGKFAGCKLVRGAYLEKERARAKRLGYPDPIQPNKAATDRDFNLALEYCIENIDSIGLFAGTHNEASTRYLIDLMAKHKVPHDHPRVEFSQLLGMSDNLSFNLAYHRFHVSKYMPYGPVKAVLPYLVRRAEENSSIKGQAGRELTLIDSELRRRSHEA